jgi:putative transposase
MRYQFIVARLMREQELFAKRPCHRTITTQSEVGAQVAAHLLERNFGAKQPNTRWVADTTSIWTAEGWLYLAVVLDLFSRMMGWSMAATQDATLVIQAFHMAIARRRPQAGCSTTLIAAVPTRVKAIKRSYGKKV